VTALILGPIAVNAALAVQVNPSAVGVAVAMGCSVAFLTPIAHPVNILMMGPGGYTARDFGRIGLGLTLVCFVALILGMLLFWQLGPLPY
jgi:di/tricarboxylate transporter